ncbi:hypothetical protein [Sphingopyxis terrae]|uniref:hypothetical protein n=1 Tax=Sphingopyxis terrae TaxID=33052 RepID=UPI001C2B983B|nr:hypothetical protein [Sphingopyxis terrae]QXF10869.1 hypothetical protein HBA51_00890 [Sphingopyxis terrae subsp. terrae]
MGLDRISTWLREFRTMRLKCRGCRKVTDIGLDKLLEMSAKNDELMWWRERFRCGVCGAKSPQMSTIWTHMTPRPTGGHPFG